MENYYDNYPKEPIGGGNPYWCCVHCKRSAPEINGKIERHLTTCKWRIAMERNILRKTDSASVNDVEKAVPNLFMHKGTGGKFTVITETIINATNENHGQRMILYVGEDGLFVRDYDEFYEKFEQLA